MLLTAVPTLVLLFWLLRLQSGLWRGSIQRDDAARLEALSRALGVRPRPVWCGWLLDNGAMRVVVRGGLFGVTSTVRHGAKTHRVDGVIAVQVLRGQAGLAP
jgi:hypothetical protein